MSTGDSLREAVERLAHEWDVSAERQNALTPDAVPVFHAGARALRTLLTEHHDVEITATAKADAWDEGFTRGFYDPLAGHGEHGHDASESAAQNPYEETP